jgi:hypothetical protein
MKISEINSQNPVIAWWSGGIASAVTCYLCVQWFGIENVRVIFIDTKNEDEDTYRFKSDCENWYGKRIETITSNYEKIEDVWFKFLHLNTSTGAICSSELKRNVREDWQKKNRYSYQAFGFDLSETNRAIALKLNHPDSKPIFPLINELVNKKNCFKYLPSGIFEIKPPRVYEYGYLNNNCFKTGCVQGGIGYWQKIRREYPDKFDYMAHIEHKLTNFSRRPVTMLKDQGKNGGLVFLKHNSDYPEIKDISMMKGREPQPLFECNGFCVTNDLQRNPTEQEINYQKNN